MNRLPRGHISVWAEHPSICWGITTLCVCAWNPSFTIFPGTHFSCWVWPSQTLPKHIGNLFMVHGEISICEFTVASITSLKITADWFQRQTRDCTINGFFFFFWRRFGRVVVRVLTDMMRRQLNHKQTDARAQKYQKISLSHVHTYAHTLSCFPK